MPLATSDRVTHWETRRGRNSEFDKTESGTGTITLLNRDGLFDPLKTSGSPYVDSNNLLPIRQVTITVNTPADPDTYVPIFTGYIEAWEYERRGPRHGIATLQIVDGFELLNNAEILPIKGSADGGMYFAEAHVDDRVRAGLQFAGWPAERTQIFSGNVTAQAFTYTVGSTMLQVIQDAADAEFPGVANFYMDKRGNACFRGRKFRFDPFNPTWGSSVGGRPANIYRFGDDGACEADSTLLPMFNLLWDFSKERVYNYVQVIPERMDPRNWYQQTKFDNPSAKKYGKRDLSINGLLTLAGDGPPSQTGGAECRRFAQYYLDNYKTPRVRATQLEVHSKFEDDRIWDFLTVVELGDVVELHTLNPGGGGFAGEQFFVDGIHNTVDAIGDWPQWVSTYDLTPRGYYGGFPPATVEGGGGGSGGGGDPGGGPEKTPMEFPVHTPGYSDSEILTCANEYAMAHGGFSMYWPHMLMQEGHIEYHGSTPGVFVKYLTYHPDGTYYGSSTEWTPIHH